MPTGLAPEIVHFTPNGGGRQERDSIGGPDFMVKPQVSIGLRCSAASWLLAQACTGLFSGLTPSKSASVSVPSTSAARKFA